MLEAALFRHDGIPGDVLHLPRTGCRRNRVSCTPSGVTHGHVAVGQKENVARVMQNRRHVRGDEVFVIAQADHRRRTVARRHNLVGIVGGNHRQREYARELLDRLADGLFQRDGWPLPLKCFSIRWAMTSVSVSVVNLCPSSMSCFFRLR